MANCVAFLSSDFSDYINGETIHKQNVYGLTILIIYLKSIKSILTILMSKDVSGKVKNSC